MIQANELRIGNWMMHQGKAKQVGSIHSDNTLRFILEDVRTEGCFSLADVTGIPLTSEILEKAGFERLTGSLAETLMINVSRFNSSFKIISVSLMPGNVYVYIREGDMMDDRENDDMVTVFNGDIDGKLYLHWLQNLYFALTNCELNINL